MPVFIERLIHFFFSSYFLCDEFGRVSMGLLLPSLSGSGVAEA